MRIDSDNGVWDDVLQRMGELPGMHPPGADLNGITSDVMLIADATMLRETGQRVRVILMKDEIGFTFRVAPEAVGIVVVDLALSGMGIEDWRGDDA
ncbi:DUF6924 domain-containing protein [Streptomyces clavifer]|uniref:DUF6924 domain-containing protein n=1 Tax=Streptomyces clavifer TaxID=68188 RepID=UPI0037A79AE6